MQKKEKVIPRNEKARMLLIIFLCAATIVFDFIHLPLSQDDFQNRMLQGILQQTCGGLAAICLMMHLRLRLFSKPQNWIFFLIALIVAIENFPFWSFFSGNMQLLSSYWTDYALFALYCMTVGVFEECIFRGVVFAVVASKFSNDKKGFWLTYLTSSLIFGGAHLFNLFGGASIGATILQIGYTVLTGGLFAFVLIKTKNIFCAAFTHGLYNFCGLLLSEQGLGAGVIFDTGTVIMMTIISVVVGVFILYHIWKISEEERVQFYRMLGVEPCEKTMEGV